MREIVKVAVITSLWALLHSLLASLTIKRGVADLVGPRAERGLYRLFYVGQSLLSFAWLLAYGRRLPTRVLYELHGPLAWLMRAGQTLGLLHALYAAHTAGILTLSGWHNFRVWRRGGPLPTAPVAQGPEAGATGELTVGGPFLWSRHPLNLSPVPIFWLDPRMTTRRLVFNLVGTFYLILGSRHEEWRLQKVYGARYTAYQTSGVPFFVPRLTSAQPPEQHSSLDSSL